MYISIYIYFAYIRIYPSQKSAAEWWLSITHDRGTENFTKVQPNLKKRKKWKEEIRTYVKLLDVKKNNKFKYVLYYSPTHDLYTPCNLIIPPFI